MHVQLDILSREAGELVDFISPRSRVLMEFIGGYVLGTLLAEAKVGELIYSAVNHQWPHLIFSLELKIWA